MLRMANAASAQAVEVGKERLRDFLESSEGGRQAMGMAERVGGDSVKLRPLDGRGKDKGDESDEEI